MSKRVTIFGTKRCEDPHMWTEANRLGSQLARRGYTVITGGGSGVMAAASNGADHYGLAECHAVARYVAREGTQTFPMTVHESSEIRKTLLVYGSHHLVFFPGSLGTIGELADALARCDANPEHAPRVYLHGVDFWRGLQRSIRSVLPGSTGIEAKAISLITDHYHEILSAIADPPED
jgi:predicted Rossmann-fold nucleotide-binding protein